MEKVVRERASKFEKANGLKLLTGRMKIVNKNPKKYVIGNYLLQDVDEVAESLTVTVLETKVLYRGKKDKDDRGVLAASKDSEKLAGLPIIKPETLITMAIQVSGETKGYTYWPNGLADDAFNSLIDTLEELGGVPSDHRFTLTSRFIEDKGPVPVFTHVGKVVEADRAAITEVAERLGIKEEIPF